MIRIHSSHSKAQRLYSLLHSFTCTATSNLYPAASVYGMFGEKAVALVKEEHRTPSEQLQQLNEDLIRQVHCTVGGTVRNGRH